VQFINHIDYIAMSKRNIRFTCTRNYSHFFCQTFQRREKYL